MTKYIHTFFLVLNIFCSNIELAPQEIADSSKLELKIPAKVLIGSGIIITGLILYLKKPDSRRYAWVTRHHFDEAFKNIETKLDEQNQLLKVLESKVDLLAQLLNIRLNSLHQDNQKIISKIDTNQTISSLDNERIKNYLVDIDQKIDLLINDFAEIKKKQNKVGSSNSINFFKDY